VRVPSWALVTINGQRILLKFQIIVENMIMMKVFFRACMREIPSPEYPGKKGETT
jgi:hypothetical protein